MKKKIRDIKCKFCNKRKIIYSKESKTICSDCKLIFCGAVADKDNFFQKYGFK